MKRLAMSLTLAVFVCAATMARAQDVAVTYTFQTVNFPNDTFTQLLGINNSNSRIAGYHGATVNKGFRLTLPSTFTSENFPGSAQTQVIGINNQNWTVGFYITAGVTHGFARRTTNNTFITVDFPNTTFNQLLGLNDLSQAAGYYADSNNIDHAYTYDNHNFSPNFKGVFRELFIPGAAQGSQATGINNLEQVCGFYISANGKNHGFLLLPGNFIQINFPGATFTQALGLNNNNQVVGFYMQGSNVSHGFLYNVANKTYQSIDDPNGVGTTVVNGINDNGWLVGFYVDSQGNTDGFVARPAA